MIAAPGRKVIPYLALRSGGRGERAILWREGVFSRQATSAKITGATDSTPRLHDTKHRQRNRQRCFGLKESGRRDLNPRPPEPHAEQGNHLKRQLVGFSMVSERRRRVPLIEMSGFAVRNGTK